MIDYDKIKQAEETLKQSLKGLKNKNEIFEAITQLVNIKVDEASKDLYDRIKERGMYDRDY